jgi:hypothetical protein
MTAVRPLTRWERKCRITQKVQTENIFPWIVCFFNLLAICLTTVKCRSASNDKTIGDLWIGSDAGGTGRGPIRDSGICLEK